MLSMHLSSCLQSRPLLDSAILQLQQATATASWALKNKFWTVYEYTQIASNLCDKMRANNNTVTASDSGVTHYDWREFED